MGKTLRQMISFPSCVQKSEDVLVIKGTYEYNELDVLAFFHPLYENPYAFTPSAEYDLQIPGSSLLCITKK